MSHEIENIKDILLDGAYITDDDVKKAEEYLETHESTLVEYFFNEGILTRELLGQAIAESLGVRFIDLKMSSLGPEDINSLPEQTAREYTAIVAFKDEESVVIATENPGNKDLENEAKSIFKGLKVEIAYALGDDIEEYFSFYRKALETRFSKIIDEQERVAPDILDEIFDDALILKASDIHFEPRIEDVVVRFRIDGILQEVGRIPMEFYENILNRIKIQSGLRIDEHYSTQDGALHYENNNTAVDMRTSIAPTVTGEKVVLRVLASYIQGLSLSQLGLSAANQDLLMNAIHKPFGMILVVGPTGSGKTTTLYALLKLLNTPDTNITTIEDPVEYKVEGLNQIQVNTQTNLTFARGLRSIVRQDPDKILVGEIRDVETAEISVNAALTGHLLLSTFHANDAPTSIPRIADMGIEPFLLASTLELVLAQRLVRKICTNCRYSVQVTADQLTGLKYNGVQKYFPKDKPFTLYRGKGCKACKHTGYRGQTAIYEFIPVTQEMQELIVHRPSSKEIWAQARKEGALTLFEDGLEKVRNGVTTLEDLLRVAQPPDDMLTEEQMRRTHKAEVVDDIFSKSTPKAPEKKQETTKEAKGEKKEKATQETESGEQEETGKKSVTSTKKK